MTIIRRLQVQLSPFHGLLGTPYLTGWLVVGGFQPTDNAQTEEVIQVKLT